jgi:hypothetical protein
MRLFPRYGVPQILKHLILSSQRDYTGFQPLRNNLVVNQSTVIRPLAQGSLFLEPPTPFLPKTLQGLIRH